MSIATVILVNLFLAAQTPAREVPDEGKPQAVRLALMKSEAARYEIRSGPGGGERAALQPEPLLRWSNPVADEEDAALFLWTRGGRPEAAAQFFVRKENWMHEFQSLGERPFEVEWAGQVVWSPERPGLRFEALPDVPPPAGSSAARSRQMREIAGTFAASVEFQYAAKSRYELRLLPRAVYRYGAEGEPAEGALWAFVQGTNPEILLLTEARLDPGSTPTWRYAIAPMTSYAAEVSRDHKPVWSVDRQPIPTPTTKGIYLFRFNVPPSPPGG